MAYFGATPFAKKVGGAFLVSPQDIDYLIKEEGELSQLLGSFTSMPKEALLFKFVVIASSKGPYSTIDSSLSLSKAWKASFVNIGEHGHISAESGHGPWPEGRQLLKNFYPIIAL